MDEKRYPTLQFIKAIMAIHLMGRYYFEVGREKERYSSCSAVLYVPDIKLEYQATAKMLKDT